MRTGHHSLNCMAWQGNNIVLPRRNETLQYWNAIPRLGPFRSYFSYNNWGYGIIGLAIEKLSGQPLNAFMKERIFDPLHLHRTKMQDLSRFDNSAISYAVLEDRSPTQVRDPTIGQGVFTEGGSGVVSTVDDMLSLYHAYLLAITDQFQSRTKSTPDNPFVECNTLLAPHNRLSGAEFSLHEQSYACGWIRCQFPGALGMIGINVDYTRMPDVLEGGPSLLCFYHMGMMVGSTSNIALIPETETVVAILANASPLGDGADWISQMVIEAIFDPPAKYNYEGLAEHTALMVLDHIPSLGRELEKRRTPGTKHSRELGGYVGVFKHDRTPFKLEVQMVEGCLVLIFNGYPEETYPLRHFHYETFSW